MGDADWLGRAGASEAGWKKGRRFRSVFEVSSAEKKWWSQFASIPALLVVLGLFGLWFFDYQKSQSAFLRSRNLRLVDAVAVHVERSLSSIQSSLHRMAQSAADGSLGRVDPDRAPVMRLRALFRHLPFVKSVDASPKGAVRHGTRSIPMVAPDPQTRIVSEKTPLVVEIDQEIPAGPGLTEEASKDIQIAVKVDLSEILRLETPTDGDGHPVFSDLVVVTADGQVVSQRDGTGGRWVHLPPELARAADKGFEREIEGSVSGQPITVFRQLVQTPRSEPLILCGLVPTARLRAEARSFPSSIQLLLLLAVVLAALAWPFLRVVFSGPAEPLRPRHTAIAATAAIALVSILTLVAIDVALLSTHRADTADAQLVQLAHDVKSRFVDELARVQDALAKLPDSTLNPDSHSHGRMFEGKEFRAFMDAYPFVDELHLVGPATAQCVPESSTPSDPSAPQTDCQIAKWSRHLYATPLYDVGSRRYVRDLREGMAWSVKGLPLVADHVRTFASGRKRTLVATYAGGLPKPGADLEKEPLRVVSAEMVSVTAPILPVGYEFAIFSENGDVVYHSVTQNSIDQNIYQELGDARPFRSMAVSVPFSTQYVGRDYRAYLTPIDGTPLRLVVLHDEVFPRTFNLRFIARMVVAGGLLFLLECLLLAVTWTRSPTYLAWSWPNPARFGRLLLAFACVAGCVCAVVIVRRVIPAQTLPLNVAAMVIGVVSCWTLLDGMSKSALDSTIARFWPKGASQWLERQVSSGASPELTKLTYVGLLTGLLVLLAVLPTLALSDLTYRWSVGQELGDEARHLQDGWAARERTLLADYHHANPDIAELRRDDQNDLYFSSAFNLKIGRRECQYTSGGYPRGTETLLAIGDRVAMSLTPQGGIPAAPVDDLGGTYAASSICTKALPALPAGKASDTQRVIEGEIAFAPLPGDWRLLAAAFPLLFALCWCAVVLFERRVDGFLDQPLPLPKEQEKRTAAEIWSQCSPEQRVVLAIVARGQLIPRCYDASVRKLLETGLIRFVPLPELMKPLDEPFMRSVPVPKDVLTHHGFHGLAWRPVFSVLLLASAVFIYCTQANGSIAFITALASIIPNLEHLTSLLNLTPASPHDAAVTPPQQA